MAIEDGGNEIPPPERASRQNVVWFLLKTAADAVELAATVDCLDFDENARGYYKQLLEKLSERAGFLSRSAVLGPRETA